MAIWDSALNLFGLGDNEALYGKKPSLPSAPTSLEILQKSLEANKAVLPDATALAKEVNTANQTELDRLIELKIPGGSDLIAKNLTAAMKGEMLPGELRALHRWLAEGAVGGGYRGGGFDLSKRGLEEASASGKRTMEGMASAQRWLAQSVAPTFSLTNMFTSPAQQYAISQNQWARDVGQAKIDAAPDPAVRGEFDTFMSLVGMVLSAYSGGAGYTGKEKPETGMPNTPPPAPDGNYSWGGIGFRPGEGKEGGSWFLGKQPGKG